MIHSLYAAFDMRFFLPLSMIFIFDMILSQDNPYLPEKSKYGLDRPLPISSLTAGNILDLK